MPPLNVETNDISYVAVEPMKAQDIDDDAILKGSNTCVLDCIHLFVAEDGIATECCIEMIHDSTLKRRRRVVDLLLTKHMNNNNLMDNTSSASNNRSIAEDLEKNLRTEIEEEDDDDDEEECDNEDTDDSILDSLLLYTSCGNEDGCGPFSCSNIVTGVLSTCGSKPKPPKGILKKSSVKPASNATSNARFPNRSQYIYNPEDDDDDEDDSTENLDPANKCTKNSISSSAIVTNDPAANDETAIPLTRSVSFSSVDVKEFKVTLGDHPNTVSGPALMLDPTQPPIKETSMDLNDFEQARQLTRRKNRRQLRIPQSDRKSILIEECGFTDKEINKAMVEAYKIRLQRSESMQSGNILASMEVLMESINRKCHGAFDMSDLCVRIK